VVSVVHSARCRCSCALSLVLGHIGIGGAIQLKDSEPTQTK